ncbi:hypothetical protein BDR05DRAFT_784996 [Suillus weaverae]|nr:hypothetical protein BDR05DRAFT_784996 [Suillus weaverae]
MIFFNNGCADIFLNVLVLICICVFVSSGTWSEHFSFTSRTYSEPLIIAPLARFSYTFWILWCSVLFFHRLRDTVICTSIVIPRIMFYVLHFPTSFFR